MSTITTKNNNKKIYKHLLKLKAPLSRLHKEIFEIPVTDKKGRKMREDMTKVRHWLDEIDCCTTEREGWKALFYDEAFGNLTKLKK